MNILLTTDCNSEDLEKGFFFNADEVSQSSSKGKDSHEESNKTRTNQGSERGTNTINTNTINTNLFKNSELGGHGKEPTSDEYIESGTGAKPTGGEEIIRCVFTIDFLQNLLLSIDYLDNVGDHYKKFLMNNGESIGESGAVNSKGKPDKSEEEFYGLDLKNGDFLGCGDDLLNINEEDDCGSLDSWAEIGGSNPAEVEVDCITAKLNEKGFLRTEG
jgi:hypothetical protein